MPEFNDRRPRKKGHKLETISTRGGIQAGCSCGEVHKNTNGRSPVWATWDREKIKKTHQAHVESV